MGFGFRTVRKLNIEWFTSVGFKTHHDRGFLVDLNFINGFFKGEITKPGRGDQRRRRKKEEREEIRTCE